MRRHWVETVAGGRRLAGAVAPITGKGAVVWPNERRQSSQLLSIPQIPYVVLHTYVDQPRHPHDEVVIHALCAELWLGEKPVAMTQPQHTFGLPPRLVKEYARQLLDALYQRYGHEQRGGFERFAREEQHSVSQCPIRPCSYHAEHLHCVQAGEHSRRENSWN